jgi:hypothetical protein
MAQLIAKCRLTGHYMFMGLDVRAEDLAAMPDTFARKFCPFCSCEHAWFKKDAKLVDKRPTPRRIQQAG